MYTIHCIATTKRTIFEDEPVWEKNLYLQHLFPADRLSLYFLICLLWDDLFGNHYSRRIKRKNPMNHRLWSFAKIENRSNIIWIQSFNKLMFILIRFWLIFYVGLDFSNFFTILTHQTSNDFKVNYQLTQHAIKFLTWFSKKDGFKYPSLGIKCFLILSNPACTSRSTNTAIIFYNFVQIIKCWNFTRWKTLPDKAEYQKK